jgi:Holliday junction resolvase RusA-like endonuclease
MEIKRSQNSMTISEDNCSVTSYGEPSIDNALQPTPLVRFMDGLKRHYRHSFHLQPLESPVKIEHCLYTDDDAIDLVAIIKPINDATEKILVKNDSQYQSIMIRKMTLPSKKSKRKVNPSRPVTCILETTFSNIDGAPLDPEIEHFCCKQKCFPVPESFPYNQKKVPLQEIFDPKTRAQYAADHAELQDSIDFDPFREKIDVHLHLKMCAGDNRIDLDNCARYYLWIAEGVLYYENQQIQSLLVTREFVSDQKDEGYSLSICHQL